MAAIWVVFGHSEVISNIEKWSADTVDTGFISAHTYPPMTRSHIRGTTRALRQTSVAFLKGMSLFFFKNDINFNT